MNLRSAITTGLPLKLSHRLLPVSKSALPSTLLPSLVRRMEQTLCGGVRFLTAREIMPITA